jgi:uncharacterized OsmC-like protein
MTTQPAEVRQYHCQARSTDTFGRVLVGARDQHLIVDGPVQNNCPGEAITPGEMLIAAVASCAVELIQVLARQLEMPLRSVSADIHALQDPASPVYPDVNVFNSVNLRLQLTGVDDAQAEDLVGRFKRRCPIYGTVSKATPDVQVSFAATSQ